MSHVVRVATPPLPCGKPSGRQREWASLKRIATSVLCAILTFMRILTRSLLWPAILYSAILHAQAPAPDTPEPGSIAQIAAATTEARFLSPWVSYLPASSTVVSPRAFWHRIPGAPGELAGTAAAYSYSRALAASSPRVKVFTIGHSEEGRDIILLAIADEAGIRDLDHLKAVTAALADPRKGRRRRGRTTHRRADGPSTISMPRCIPMRPAQPKPLWSWPTAWRFPSSPRFRGSAESDCAHQSGLQSGRP